jgi:hypothetical protein
MCLSIIIVSFKPSHYLINCISSIIQHTKGIDFEIIIVINGKIDQEMIKNLKNYSNKISIKLIVIENQGYGAACNEGVKIALGKFVAILNDDVEILDNVFYKLIDVVNSNHLVGVISPLLVNSDGSIQKSISRLPSLSSNIYRELFSDRLEKKEILMKTIINILKIFNLNPGRLSDTPLDIVSVECVMGSFFMLPKDVFLQTKGFDSDNFFMFLEEGDLFKRISDLGYQIYFYPFSKVVHYGGATTIEFDNVYLIQKYKSYLIYYQKHKGPFYQQIHKLFIIIIILSKLSFIKLKFLFNKSDIIEHKKINETYESIIRVVNNRKFRSINVMKYKGYKYITPINK